jgi:hypothetical protein
MKPDVETMTSSPGDVYLAGHGRLDITARSGSRCGGAAVASKDVQDA